MTVVPKENCTSQGRIEKRMQGGKAVAAIAPVGTEHFSQVIARSTFETSTFSSPRLASVQLSSVRFP